MDTLPRFGETAQAGLHYVLPIAVLMWCLVVERFSPGLAAFWATVCLVFIVLTERPLLAFLRQRATGADALWKEFRRGFGDLVKGPHRRWRAQHDRHRRRHRHCRRRVVGTITLTGIGAGDGGSSSN